MLFRFILFLIAAWFVAYVFNRIATRVPARRDGARSGSGSSGSRAPDIPREQIIDATYTEIQDGPDEPPPAP